MPFDEEDDQPVVNTKGLKQVSSQKSFINDMPKKTSPEEFNQQVKKVQDRVIKHKSNMADLAIQLFKIMADKTLLSNKNMFQQELERETMKDLIRLAQEINADPNEREGEGSLSLITLLMKTCTSQRDRINNLEYVIAQFEKKIEALDSKKKSE